MLLDTIQFLITHSAAPVAAFAVFGILGFLLGLATWRKQAREFSVLRAERAELTGKIAQASLADSSDAAPPAGSE